jgi:RNA polymerase sigma-70 factor (ECF subfamily)
MTGSAASQRRAPGFSNTSEVWLEAEALRSDFYRFVRRRLHDDCAVEDVLQDFYVRVFENAHLLKDERSVRPWLYRLLRSSLIDCARSDLRQRNIAALLGSTAPSYVEDAPFYDPTCAEMLGELKPEYSDILVRMRLRGDTAEEAAADLGTTPNNIRVRHFRARAALRDAYGRDNPAARLFKTRFAPSFVTATA